MASFELASAVIILVLFLYSMFICIILYIPFISGTSIHMHSVLFVSIFYQLLINYSFNDAMMFIIMLTKVYNIGTNNSNS